MPIQPTHSASGRHKPHTLGLGTLLLALLMGILIIVTDASPHVLWTACIYVATFAGMGVYLIYHDTVVLLRRGTRGNLALGRLGVVLVVAGLLLSSLLSVFRYYGGAAEVAAAVLAAFHAEWNFGKYGGYYSQYRNDG